MSQREIFADQKEHQVRKFVGRFFILLVILDVLLVSSHSTMSRL